MTDSKRMANKRVQATLYSAPNPRGYDSVGLPNRRLAKHREGGSEARTVNAGGHEHVAYLSNYSKERMTCYFKTN
jgi:hypothetical protein